jgi:hypothetical protein
MSDPPKVPPMTPIIRPARSGEYDEVTRVWLNSWASTGIEAASREGFVFEKEEANPMTGFMVKFYRWKKEGIAR